MEVYIQKQKKVVEGTTNHRAGFRMVESKRHQCRYGWDLHRISIREEGMEPGCWGLAVGVSVSGE